MQAEKDPGLRKGSPAEHEELKSAQEAEMQNEEFPRGEGFLGFSIVATIIEKVQVAFNLFGVLQPLL